MNFIKGIKIKEKIEKDEYPYNIKVLKNFEELRFESPVTFFVGENGTGKSTFIEAIAVAYGLNPEGGSQNFNFETKASHSSLYNNLVILKSGILPTTKYFLRAESFYNVASEIDNISDAVMSHGGKSLHTCSHGESFMQLMQNRFYNKGVYILDEPEAALSPSRLMSMLVLINNLVKNDSQFIIATHSPILLAYPNATIYNFDSNHVKKIKFKETEHYKLTKLFIDNPELMIDRLFNEEE